MSNYPPKASDKVYEKCEQLTEESLLRRRGYLVGVNLGSGSYAKVKSAYSQSLRKEVAIKIICLRKAPNDFKRKFLPRELHIVKTLRHPNIIEVYEIMEMNNKIYIAMEKAGHGDLLDYIRLRRHLREDQAKVMFEQILNAIEYLHNRNIVHRDLKCENLLLDTRNRIKVTDFGFAREIFADQLSKTYCGSAAYAAPEILEGTPYKAFGYDIWSMGVILFIMVCGSMPFDDSNVRRMIRDQKERGVVFPRRRKVSEEVRHLILKILCADPLRRATLVTIRQSSWLKSVGPTPQSGSNVEESSSSSSSEKPGKKIVPESKKVTIASNRPSPRSPTVPGKTSPRPPVPPRPSPRTSPREPSSPARASPREPSSPARASPRETSSPARVIIPQIQQHNKSKSPSPKEPSQSRQTSPSPKPSSNSKRQPPEVPPKPSTSPRHQRSPASRKTTPPPNNGQKKQ